MYRFRNIFFFLKSSNPPSSDLKQSILKFLQFLTIFRSITRSTIPEEVLNGAIRRNSWLPPPPRSSKTSRHKVKRQQHSCPTDALMSSPSPTPTDESSMDEEDADIQSLMKAGFN